MKAAHRSIRVLTAAALIPAALAAGGAGALLGACGPFTDVAADAFCPFVLEIFYVGITTGTTATTYDPSGNVTRLQMAAFLSRSVDGVLKRGSRRAALNQFWTLKDPKAFASQSLGLSPGWPASDGTDVWAPTAGFSDFVRRYRASDDTPLDTWTGATKARGVLVALGRVIATGYTSPGNLYSLYPTSPGGVTTVASTLGNLPDAITFDGSHVWTANNGGSVSIITYDSGPWTVTTVTAGFSEPHGALYDGSNVWVTDNSAGTLLKLDGNGAVLQTVTVGSGPLYPIFDGSLIWVPNNGSGSVSVVRASSGVVLATLTGNGLNGPYTAAFDGERVLVTNPIGDSVSLWKAANLAPIGSVSTGSGSQPLGACSDGISFFLTMNGSFTLTKF